ncbi:hypothetical protein PYJP_04070 [Pyrofollis japonicus]|uniref:hypothetical protein n=1 Tax=Pyrofollis japonicus TaxID=3060460 RepID=UPI00295B7F0F|nr:hypothetical protein [Pyrofollis japonicus]BEP17055.1 hypothetical protein PYJP_04070 [Pyrofollis japonicus]
MRPLPVLEKISYKKRIQRLDSLVGELADEIKEMESLLARITETYGRISLIVELEKKRLGKHGENVRGRG